MSTRQLEAAAALAEAVEEYLEAEESAPTVDASTFAAYLEAVRAKMSDALEDFKGVA